MKKVIFVSIVVVLAVAVAVFLKVPPRQKTFRTPPPTPIASRSASSSPSLKITERAFETISSRTDPRVGQYLTDGNGMTLYVFGKESGKSTCYDACAKTWVPYKSDGEKLTGPEELTKRINVYTRTDGSNQYAYGQTPLYYYKDDQKPGDINGWNKEAGWSPVPLK